MNIELFNKIMKDVFDTKIEKEDDEYIYYQTLGGVTTKLNKVEFENIIENLKGYSYENNQITNEIEYESLVKYESYNQFIGKLNKRCSGLKDVVEYKLGNASLYLILNVLEDAYNVSGRSLHNMFFKNFKHYSDFRNEIDESVSVIKFLKYLTKEFQSITVKFKTPQLISFKLKCAELYLFQLAYDNDYVISLLDNDLNFLFRNRKHFGSPRKKITELNRPTKNHEITVIKLYKRALFINTIEYQYLSFYQILEYFYDRILIEKGTDGMKDLIKQDVLSHEDIYALMVEIHDDHKKSNEEELLNKVLIKYLEDDDSNNEVIKKEIERFDKSLIEYYKTHIPSFSNGSKIDFNESDFEKIMKRLSKRIYSIRNSIVHRKSGKNKFDPLLNSKELIPETILIRVVCEIVINNYSYDL